MRFAPVQLMTDGNMASSLSSIGIDLNQTVMYSIQAVFSGSPVGTLKLQISNDIVPVAPVAGNPVGSNPAANVVNWTDYTGSSTAVSAAGNFVWNVFDVGYRWVRVVYTRSSGTGTLNITYSGKSI